MKNSIVVVKIQKPLFTTGSKTELLAYIVDEDGRQIGEDYMFDADENGIKKLSLDEYSKVYFMGTFDKGQVNLLEPTWIEEWV